MVKKLLVSLATLSILLGANAYAYYGDGQCNMKPNICNMKPNSCNTNKRMGYSGKTATNVINAVSKTGLSAAQTKKIAEGIAEYRATMSKVRQMRIFPIDSFINDNFNEKQFISEMSEKYIAKIAAKAALYKYVFAVLNDEQRKIFKREYAAPLINRMIAN